MPASPSVAQALFMRRMLPAISKPPSVVNSSRFSGTKQQAKGFTFKAMPIISSVTAISIFKRVCSVSFNKNKSLS